MKKKMLLLMVMLPLIACNLPSMIAQPTSDAASVSTQAAQTVAAELTRIAAGAATNPIIPTNTTMPSPTNTQVFTPSKTPIPCLLVGFSPATIDQTVPDNTVMMPSQVFTKTWRLTNNGTCTWNSSYQLVFDHGDGMGVPPNYSQTLTAGTVAPGQSVDVSVNLTAPAAPGTYTGYWRFRDPNGVYFGIGGAGSWIVKIIVPVTDMDIFAPVVGLSGTLREGAGPWPDYTVGESNVDLTKTTEAFLTYDITGIPAGATILEVRVNFSAYVVSGNPFGLGTLHGYVTDYGGSLEPADFVVSLPAGASALNWTSTAGLDSIQASSDLKTALQSRVGTSRFQIRLQYAGSNMDAVRDRLTLTNPSLNVTFALP
jgi:hypothetical protein